MSEPGVYLVGEDGGRTLVHAYLDGDYGLENVPEWLGIGTVAATGSAVRLELTRRELRELRVLVDARSFDFEDGFVEMCRQISARTDDDREGAFRFEAIE